MRIEIIEIEGLWSYKDPQTIDVSGLSLVAVEGENHTGKSAILMDAVVVALYAKFPTLTIEESIFTGAKTGTVTLTFTVGGERYRVSRTYSRNNTGATATLDREDASSRTGWKPLTEKGPKVVNQLIVDLLGMDYTMAAMTWLSEQEQSGQFAKAKPGERFKLLSSVFDLDHYSELADNARAQEKKQKTKVEHLEGRITEIGDMHIDADIPVELAGFAALTADELSTQLAAAQADVDEKTARVAEHAAADPGTAVVTARQAVELVRNGRVTALRAAEASAVQANTLGVGARQRAAQQRAQAESTLTNANEQVDTAYQAEQQRITVAQSNAQNAIAQIDAAIGTLTQLTANEQAARTEAAGFRALADTLATDAENIRSTVTALRAERATLVQQIDDANARISTLTRGATDSEHASCFTCNQHLTAADAAALIAVQQDSIARMLERTNAINIEGQASITQVDAVEANRAEQLRLAGVSDAQAQTFAAQLAQANAQASRRAEFAAVLAAAGGDLEAAAQQHGAARARAVAAHAEAVTALEADETESITAAGAQLDAANAAIQANAVPSEEETALTEVLAAAERIVAGAGTEHATVRAELETVRDSARELARLLGTETSRRAGHAAARTDQDERMAKAVAELAAAQQELSVISTLVKAYSPGGIPAMKLGSVLGELNDAINEPLRVLSDGELSIELRTTRETAKGGSQNQITVYVQTPLALRDYDNLSGGQQFRVNLAIRQGLTNIISRGTGIPIETFLLDEGWGTLDKKGIAATFSVLEKLSATTSVLTVSHIEEVRDAFASRIEVHMNEGMSNATVIR